MKILTHLSSGALRALKSWKGVLVIWILVLFLISLLALPVKSGFKSLIGSSMITELLADTINIDVITDLSGGLASLMPALTFGFLLVCFFGFLLNSFVTGGMFTILSSKTGNQSAGHFFQGAASNFWSVLVISLITGLIIMLAGAIIIGIPVGMVSGFGSKTAEPGAMGKTVRVSLIAMGFVLPVLLLVADYSRAWLVVNDIKKPFKAIGFGFSRTFKTFLLSYPSMLILILVQAGFGALVVSKLLGSKPSTGGDVFLMFIVSQLLFIVKIMLRAWRYGSVTSMMEEKIQPKEVFQDLSVPVSEPLPDQV
jgi:hypothetical protein